MKLVFVASPRSNKQKKRAKNEEQTIQWPKDRQYNGQKSEDTKGVIRRCKSKKDRQCKGEKKED